MGIEAALLKKKVHYTKKEIKMGMVIIRKGINVVAGFSLRSSKERNLKVATTDCGYRAKSGSLGGIHPQNR